MKKYIIYQKDKILYNIKSHDLITKYLKSFNYEDIYLKPNYEIIRNFVLNNNNEETKIIIYDAVNNEVNNIFIDVIQEIDNLQIKIIFFSFDFWIHPDSAKHIKTVLLKKVFKAKNYKVVCFCNDLDELNFYHNADYSEYKDNIIFFNLWGCYESSYLQLNENPIYKLLVPGTVLENTYPERFKLLNLKYSMIDKYYNRLDYSSDSNLFNITLNKYYACFSSSVYVNNKTKNIQLNTHAILLKTYEILAAGSLLVMPVSEEKYIKKIGLVNMHNCYLIDFDKELISQIDYIFQNRDIFDKIKINGYNHAIDNLKATYRYNELNKILNF